MSKNSPVINFDAYKIYSMEYKSYDSDDEYNKKLADFPLEMNIIPFISEDNKNGKVSIDVSFSNESKKSIGKVSLAGFFSVDENVNAEDAKQYLAVNGSAMVYPYIRTITSILTGLDDSNVTTLNSINFYEAFKNINSGNND